MKKYVFNQDLKTGILISDGKVVKMQFSDVKDCKDLLFILPNELISFVEFRHELKNKKNIHAALINKMSSLGLDKETPKVLDTNDPHAFFLVNQKNMQVIDQLFKKFDENIKITSDLLFFKELHGVDLAFENNIFLFRDEEAVKLSKKSLKLLDIDESKLKTLKNSDLDINVENKFYNLNTFNIASIFNKKLNYRIAYISLGLVVVFSAIGLININSNHTQIKQMDDALERLYTEIFPNEEIIDIKSQIKNKLNTLSISNQSNLAKVMDITNEIAPKTNILEVKYTTENVMYKCLFKNDSEESIFINQLKRMNINFRIDSRENNQLGVVTNFIYEL